MSNAEQIALVYSVGGTVFLLGFFLAVVTTGARVIWYIRHGQPRPRLLNRDILVKGGMFTSFGLITLVRFLPSEQRTAFTLDNVPWALVTTIPAVMAILVYCGFEVFVIPRASKSEEAGEVALEASVQENIALTKEAGNKADAAYAEAKSK